MLRRDCLSIIGGAAIMPSTLNALGSTETHEQTGSELKIEDILSVETADRGIPWIKRTLRNAIPRYWKQPNRGVYHIGPDTEYRVPKSYQSVKLYANLFHRQLGQVYEHNRYDCDNFAFDLRDAFTRMNPFINSIGVMIDTERSHAYNVIVVDDQPKKRYGSVHMWEPQLAKEEDYSSDKGVLIL
ncbi:MAG: hypothetical protein J07HQX50_00358 [Haloquadratum sp. J07HQX50]|nr:MAG: hypothetical protein J07HQX50_00358 [Haloquadratum sp. J07HQX50]